MSDEKTIFTLKSLIVIVLTSLGEFSYFPLVIQIIQKACAARIGQPYKMQKSLMHVFVCHSMTLPASPVQGNEPGFVASGRLCKTRRKISMDAGNHRKSPRSSQVV